MSKLSIVVSIYKNEKNIAPFYEDFVAKIKPYIGEYEIIFVNDASPDNSWNELLKIAKKDKNVKLLNHSRNFGGVAASYTGLKYSTGDCVTVRACDLQEPAEVLLEMYNQWKAGAKSVLAVRKKRNDKIVTNLFSNFYYKLVQVLVDKHMPQGGFDTYLIDRALVDNIININDSNSPITLQILWMGFEPHIVYYERVKREIGKSSWTFSKKMKLFVDTMVCFSYVPVRIMSVIGILFSSCSMVWMIYLIIMKMLNRVDMKGYTSIMVLIMFSSGIIMFTLGVLGEYVWRILDSTRNRPISIVKEIVKNEEDV